MPRYSKKPDRLRKGMVLLGVLVVIVLLSLAAYHYSDLALSGYKAADQTHRMVQAQALADSGVHYAAAMLSNPDNMTNVLYNNPYHNPSAFSKIKVSASDGNGYSGTFTLYAPPDPQDASGTFRNGVTDEGGKINLNTLIAQDPTGNTALNVLSALPNMTSDIASSMVDYIDPDDTALPGGAETDYYSGLSPSYAAKNGPLDSLDELLLVKGMTPEFLFGQFRNPYPLPNPGQTTSNSPIDLGLSAFLTAHSRELLVDSSGNPLVYLNDNDLNNLNNNLSALGIPPNMINFIIMYRQYGASATAAPAGSGGGGTMAAPAASAPAGGKTGDGDADDVGKGNSSSSSSQPTTGDPGQYTPDLTKNPTNNINSLFDLVNANVSIASGKTTVSYPSPLTDPNTLGQVFPQLFAGTTVYQGSGSIPQIPARININTAPLEVLQALEAIVDPTSNQPYLQDSDVQTIVSTRPPLTSDQPFPDTFSSPAWLITQAGLDPKKLSKLDPYITTRSQVFRVQVQGTLDVPGNPSARVEAVIDTNGGMPRIIAYRNLTELGKGGNVSQGGGQ